jgi:hypothetical protein
MIYRPRSPPGSYSGAFAAEIRSHLEDLTYNPDAPLPDLLAGLSGQRLPSCTAVRNFYLNADALGEGGGRKVDMKTLPFRQSIGTEEETGSHARPIVDQLEKADYGTIALIIQESLRRQ